MKFEEDKAYGCQGGICEEVEDLEGILEAW